MSVLCFRNIHYPFFKKFNILFVFEDECSDSAVTTQQLSSAPNPNTHPKPFLIGLFSSSKAQVTGCGVSGIQGRQNLKKGNCWEEIRGWKWRPLISLGRVALGKLDLVLWQCTGHS